MVSPSARRFIQPRDAKRRPDFELQAGIVKPTSTFALASRGQARAFDLCAFGLPALSFVQVSLIGRLQLAEVLLLVLLPWLRRAPDRLGVPRWFTFLWGAWFLSQVLTDAVVGSAFADYSRGWAAIIFTLTNFSAIAALVSTPRRARLFGIGLAFGGVATYFVHPDQFPPGDLWKWAFAIPIGLVLAAVFSGRRGSQARWLSILVFAGFGALSLRLDYRSLGAVALLTAAYLVLNGLVGSSSGVVRPSIPRVLAGALFGLLTAWSVLTLYDTAASGGLLGPEVQTKYQQQSGLLGVVIGGRSEGLVSTQAIIDSPLLGHGSWAKDFKYVYLLSDRLSTLGYDEQDLAQIYQDGLIPTHSYLLGAWVQAGVFGGIFWFVIALAAVWLLVNFYAVRSSLAPLLVFSPLLLLWAIAFSPYANAARLTAPYAIALCMLGLRQLGASRELIRMNGMARTAR